MKIDRVGIVPEVACVERPRRSGYDLRAPSLFAMTRSGSGLNTSAGSRVRGARRTFYMLERINEFVLFALALAAFIAVIELGFRLGRRHRHRNDDAGSRHIQALQAALLGLLALLLGFNFAMAVSRFDGRKALVQEEVNAIGTTFLRAELLPDVDRHKLKNLLRTYVDTRLAYMRAGTDAAALAASDAESMRIDQQLWRETSEMTAHASSTSPVALFVQSMNDMINLKWKRRAALDNHVPEAVLHLLFLVATGALGFIGYGYGLTCVRRHGSTAIFALLIALVLAIVLDLDRPRGGFIRVSHDEIVRLKSAMQQDAPP